MSLVEDTKQVYIFNIFINSWSHFKDERILINTTTIGNLLLEEAPEDVLNEPEGRGEIVSEMLAGTIRGLAQTVSRTATSGIKVFCSKNNFFHLFT